MRLSSELITKSVINCFFLIAFLIIAITASGQILQDVKRVIFLKGTSILFDLTKDNPQQRFTPTASEIDSADLVLDNYFLTIDSVNSKNHQVDNYFRQYVGLWLKGQKIIFINCSCHKPDHFSENSFYPKGGGQCYFRTLININTKQVCQFYFNAPK
jgi:hypothetical protein